MKRTNKLIILVLAAIILINIQSCAKTEFHPDYLLGTWTMTSLTEETSTTQVFEDLPEEIYDGNTVKEVFTTKIKYQGTDVTGSSTKITDYDGNGSGAKKQEERRDIKGSTIYVTTNTINTDNSDTAIFDTLNFSSSRNYSISFKKDKSFILIDNQMLENKKEIENTQLSGVYINSHRSEHTYEGTWAYIGADKILEEKNNERIGLWFSKDKHINEFIDDYKYFDKDLNDTYDPTKLNNTSTTIETTEDVIKSTYPDLIWKMVEGSDKEMTIKVESSSNKKGSHKVSEYAYNSDEEKFMTEMTETKVDITSSNISTISFKK